MKLAFIHPMRSGGAYVMSQLAAAGLQRHCSWFNGMNRDWLRKELIHISYENSGIAHNHLINWSPDLVKIFQNQNWVTFTVARDPIDQLMSLYHFIKEPTISIDEFIEKQLAGEIVEGLNYFEWCMPTWVNTIDIVIPWKEDLYESLIYYLGLPNNIPRRPHENGRPRKHEPSAKTKRLVEKSFAQERYIQALTVCRTRKITKIW